jgi:hypothetical protein
MLAIRRSGPILSFYRLSADVYHWNELSDIERALITKGENTTNKLVPEYIIHNAQTEKLNGYSTR